MAGQQLGEVTKMSEVQQMQQKQLPVNKVMLSGLLKSFYKNDNDNYMHEIIVAAPDAYSYPKRFQIVSSKPLGELNSQVSALCTINGYTRSYQRKDGETGTSYSVMFIAD